VVVVPNSHRRAHQGGGANPFAISWVGVTASFPQYRGREDRIGTVEERINGCMERSMNGKPLPLDAPERKVFTTCIAFLSRGVPLGASHTATVLNGDDAYDLTAFVLSKPRPAIPQHSIATSRAGAAPCLHQHRCDRPPQ
jgi:cytochrome c